LRRPLSGLVAAALLLPGCALSAVDAEQQAAIDRARERNTVAGAALALLVALVVRHAVRLVSARRRERRMARAPWTTPWATTARPPVAPWLVAAAVATEVFACGTLLGSGALLGFALGPVPGTDRNPLSGVVVALVVAFFVPVALGLVSLAIVVQGIAARLPDVGVPTLVILGVPHLAVAAAASSAVTEPHPNAFGWGVLALALLGLGGFWGEAAHQVAARRRRRRAALPG
jgi:hypothetical protein